jgi:hypothetical protein
MDTPKVDSKTLDLLRKALNTPPPTKERKAPKKRAKKAK